MSDIAELLLIGSVGLAFLLGRIPASALRESRISWLLLAPFLFWSFFTLVLHMWNMGYSSSLLTLLYYIRLIITLLLFPVFFLLFQDSGTKALAKTLSIAIFVILVAIGYGQMFLFPSLAGIGGGWDPHIHRMVSSWLDPNFFGAFIVLMLPCSIYWTKSKNIFLMRAVQGVLLIGGMQALFLTKSRSAIIAACVAGAVVCFVSLFPLTLARQWKKAILLVAIGGIAGGILVFGMLGDRASGIFTHDPTVALRMNAYTEVWRRLVAPHILMGVGYNAYQFAAKDVGMIQDFSIHSRAGSDSSILTLLVTMGIIGTMAFLLPFLYGIYWHMLRWMMHLHTPSLLFIWASTALLIHSQFENSLLYSHLLIPFIIIAALTSP